MDENKNPYAILGLERGHLATADDIRKAYKKMAILKHPDKNRNNPNAAAEFDELKKAYELLTDDQAKGAYDDLIRAKEARDARRSQHTEKRRKMMDDLERRERQVATEKSEEEQARARLKVELERLRRKAAEEQRKQAEAAAAARKASGASAAPAAPAAGAQAPATAASSAQDQLSRSVKVSWDSSISDYSSDRLRELFGRIGTVEDVVMRDRKKKGSKMSALVVFAAKEGANAALATVTGDIRNPLLVVPVMRDAGGAPAAAAGAGAGASQQQPQLPVQQNSAAASKPAFPVAPSAAGLFPLAGSTAGASIASSSLPSASGFSSFPAASFSSFSSAGAAGGSSFESSILDKMRKAAERERLIAEMKAQDGEA